jgi:hypothetical protein
LVFPGTFPPGNKILREWQVWPVLSSNLTLASNETSGRLNQGGLPVTNRVWVRIPASYPRHKQARPGSCLYWTFISQHLLLPFCERINGLNWWGKGLADMREKFTVWTLSLAGCTYSSRRVLQLLPLACVLLNPFMSQRLQEANHSGYVKLQEIEPRELGWKDQKSGV